MLQCFVCSPIPKVSDKRGNRSEFHSEINYYLQNWYFSISTRFSISKSKIHIEGRQSMMLFFGAYFRGIMLSFNSSVSTLRSLLNKLARLTIVTIVKQARSFNRDLRVIWKINFRLWAVESWAGLDCEKKGGLGIKIRN